MLHLLLILVMAQANPTGLFHEQGERGELFADKDRNISDEVREKLNTIEGWSRLASTAKSETYRVSAATTLAHIGLKHQNREHVLSPAELASLRKQATLLCKSKDEQVRFFAVNTLGYVGDKGTLAPLLELLKDKNAYMRLAVIEAMDGTADDSCIEPLLASLKVRRTQLPLGFNLRGMNEKALAAIAKIGSEKAKLALDKLELSTRDAELKEAIRIAVDKWRAIQKP